MARNLGTFAAPFNFKVTMQEAFDPRVVVGTKRELTTKATWPCDGDTLYLYNGLQVSVVEEKAVYMLIDINKALEEDYSGWLRIDAGNAEQVPVIDNLESDSAVAALSAKQGKVLMGEIAGVKAKLVNIYTYKGSKDTYEELPTEGVAAGDVWNVAAAYGQHPAGTNYAWVTDLTGGGHWDALGGSLDLSGYFTKTEVEAAIKVESDRADAEEKRLAGLIDANAQAIAGALGDISSQASSIEQLGISLGETNAEVAKKVNAVVGYSLISAEDLAQITTNKESVATIHDALYTENQGIVKRIADLEKFFSDDTIEGGLSLADVNAAISALQADKAEASEVNDLKQRVEGIVTINTEQSTAIAELTNTVTGYHNNCLNGIQNLTSVVDGHTTVLGTVQTNLGDLTTLVNTINGDYLKAADIAGKLDTATYTAKVAELEKADTDNLAAAQQFTTEAVNAISGSLSTHVGNTTVHITDAERIAWNAAKSAIDTFLKDADMTAEAVDTLKELQSYMTSDGAAASELVGRVAALEAVKDDYLESDKGVLQAAQLYTDGKFNTLGSAATMDAAAFATAAQGAKADAAAPQATTYTKTEVNDNITAAIAAAFEWQDVK